MRVDVPRSAFAAAIAAVLVLAGCGSSGSSGDPAHTSSNPQSPARAKAAGAPKPVATAQGVVLTRDPEEDQSFPLPAGTRGAKEAPTPASAPAPPRRKAPAAPRSRPALRRTPQIRRELKQMEQAVKDFKRGARGAGIGRGPCRGQRRGPRADARPARRRSIARIIAGGNAIAKFPYVWGGGHGSFVDSGYDCSGSVSYALAAAGLLDSPLVSGGFAKWGSPGPGKWVTIYANDGHVFMYVAGLRFDTSGRDGPFGSRWQTAPRSLAGFRSATRRACSARARRPLSCRSRARARSSVRSQRPRRPSLRSAAARRLRVNWIDRPAQRLGRERHRLASARSAGGSPRSRGRRAGRARRGAPKRVAPTPRPV